MAPEPILVATDVRRLALEGRVAPDPAYHAHEHALSFKRIVAALSWCQRVDKDRRTTPGGALRHPRGWLAWCEAPGAGHLRVDFNLEEADDGQWILVVTAMAV